MSDIVTRYTKTVALSNTEGDYHIADECLTYAGATLTLDETHNRQHIILQDGCTAIEFTATATLSAALDEAESGVSIGWYCKITNNTGVAVTFNASGLVQFNGSASEPLNNYVLYDNCSVIVAFDDVSSTKGYYIVSQYTGIHQHIFSSESLTGASTKSKAFTCLPEKIVVALTGVAWGATATLYIRIGTGGVFTASSHSGVCNNFDGVTSPLTATTSTTGIPITTLTTAGENHDILVTFQRSTGYNWVVSGSWHSGSAVEGGSIVGWATPGSGYGDIIEVGLSTGTFSAGAMRVEYWSKHYD